MIVDVSAFVGEYPFRSIDEATPERLLREMDRVGIDRAWVGHLPSAFFRDPAPGTARLVRALERHRKRLVPVPTVHPGLPAWDDDLNFASLVGAPAVRVYPNIQGVEPTGDAMRVLVTAAAAVRLPLLLTVRFEDARQRHPHDSASELPAAAVRLLIREDPDARFLVCAADRAFIEEVHFGLTTGEASRILWDISWIWGPPEDHLALLLETIGIERFVMGTGMPLRVPDGVMAKLDLLDLDAPARARITGGNLAAWRGSATAT